MGSLSRTRLSNFTLTFHFHALGKEMATHSSVLAWGIPGTAEPGGLPSLGSHRVRHNWSGLAAAAAVAAYTVHGIARGGQDLATTPPPPPYYHIPDTLKYFTGIVWFNEFSTHNYPLRWALLSSLFCRWGNCNLQDWYNLKVTDLVNYGAWIETQITMFVFEIESQNQISEQRNLRNI